MSVWYYTKDGKTKTGPVSEPQLRELVRSGQLRPTDMVQSESAPKWVPASQVDGLFASAPAVPVEPIEQTGAAAKVEELRQKAQQLLDRPEVQRLTEKAKRVPRWAWLVVAPLVFCCLPFGLVNMAVKLGGGGHSSGHRADVTLAESDLLREFVSNKASAESKYKGKYLKVHGKVSQVLESGGMLGGPNVSFFNPNPDNAVHCVFADADSLKPFYKLSHATVIGKCDGAVRGSTGGLLVVLRDCELVKEGQQKQGPSDDGKKGNESSDPGTPAENYKAGYQGGYSVGQRIVENWKVYNISAKQAARPDIMNRLHDFEANYKKLRDRYGEDFVHTQFHKGRADGYRKALLEGGILP